MDPVSLEGSANYINQQYPWATEDTVQRIAELSRSNNIKSTAIAAGLLKSLGALDAKRLEKYIKDATNDVNRSQQDTEKFINETKKQTTALSRAVFNEQAGLEGMSTLANATAESLHHLAKEGTNLAATFTGSFGQSIGKYVTAGTGTVVAATSIASIFSKLITEQDQQVRKLIDFGVVLGDVANYTTIRGQLADLGMSMAQYNDIMSGVQGLVTSNNPAGLVAGSGKMLTFLASSSTQESIRHFGYTPAQASKALAQEAEHLFELNQVNELNEAGQRRTIESFQTINEMALFMAEKFGVDRSALLESRRAARENMDFKLAMVQQRELLENQYGEGAAQRSQEAYDWLSMLAPMLGEDFGTETLKIFGGTLGDLHMDSSAVNNMLDQGFAQRLRLVGPGVYSEYVKLIEDGVTGRIESREEMTARFAALVKLIKESDPRISVDNAILESNKLISAATLIPDDILSMSVEEIGKQLSGIRTVVDGADDAIQGVGDMSRMFLQAQHQITPGYESMHMFMNIMSTSVEEFTGFWTGLFGSSGSTRPRPLTVAEATQRLTDDMVAGMTGQHRGGGSDASFAGSNTSNVQTAQQTVSDLEQELATANNALVNTQEQLGLTGADADAANAALMEELKTSRSTAEQQKQEARNAFDIASTAASNNAEIIASKNQEYNNIVNDVERERSVVRQALEKARIENADQEEIDRLAAEEAAANSAYESAQEQARPVQEELNKLLEQQQQLVAVRNEQRTALATATANLLAAENVITNAERNVDAYRISTLRAAEQQLTTQIQGIESSLTEARAAVERSREESAALASSPAMSGLLSSISSGEGGYNSSNRGTIGNNIIGSTHRTVRGGKELPDMTIAEIMQYQTITNPNDPNRLFAVGRYQIIPGTMKAAVSATGIDVNRKFDQAAQDELGIWLVTGKRPAVGRYIRGESNDLMLAMEQLALEFASFPVPRDMTVRKRFRRTGQSAYGSGNKASHSIPQVREMLERAREQHAEQQAQAQQATTATVASSTAQTQNNTTASTVTTPPAATVSDLQSRRQQMETEIKQIAGEDRLNTTTGDINTTGLSNEQVSRLRSLETQLQTTIREIADLQSRSGR